MLTLPRSYQCTYSLSSCDVMGSTLISALLQAQHPVIGSILISARLQAQQVRTYHKCAHGRRSATVSKQAYRLALAQPVPNWHYMLTARR